MIALSKYKNKYRKQEHEILDIIDYLDHHHNKKTERSEYSYKEKNLDKGE